MTPVQELYRRGCRSLIGLFEVGDVKSLGVYLVRETYERVRGILTKLLATQR